MFEVAIGVVDVDAAIHHWEQFGFAVQAKGALERSAAQALYGTDSAVQSYRMGHQHADKGLVRLMQWEWPIADGLQMAPLRTPGNRWTVQRTDDLLQVWTHAEVARRQGKPIQVLGPVLNARIAAPVVAHQPFVAPVPASYNLQMFQPQWQQIVMQRQGIDTSRLGSLAASSLFHASEVCHYALVVHTGELGRFDFYDQVLGLHRTAQRRFEYELESPASDMLGLRQGEAFTEIDFDDPRAQDDTARSTAGRLRVFAIETATGDEQRIDTQPGCLGYSMYTVLTNNIETLRHEVSKARSANVGPLTADEFGQRAFTFRAPDGFYWAAIDQPAR